MPNYNFTIEIAGVDYAADIETKLFEAGCNDALICTRDDAVYLEFDRDAESLAEAVASAKRDIESAGFAVVK